MAKVWSDVTRGDVISALETVLDECSPSRGYEGYAMTYASHAIEHPEMTDADLHHQVLYVLSNIQTWRGPRARECKKILRSWKP